MLHVGYFTLLIKYVDKIVFMFVIKMDVNVIITLDDD